MSMSKSIMAGVVAVFVLPGCVQPVTVAPQPAPMVMGPGPVYVQQPGVGMVTSPGVVYVAPTYPAPAVGFLWEFHPRYGWGWRHPHRGWHRGWR